MQPRALTTMMTVAALLAVSSFAACTAASSGPTPAASPAGPSSSPESQPASGATALAAPVSVGQAEAIFAGGCFWCMETAFEGVPGVLYSISGYTGGQIPGASYEQVSAGRTGHYEAVRVIYDPARISYAQLLRIFVHNIDPTQGDGQFCDRGSQYRAAVFVADSQQRHLAEEALAEAGKQLQQPIVTEVLSAAPFYLAEAYHQDFFRTHSEHYQRYREGCGRDARLQQLWGAQAPQHP